MTETPQPKIDATPLYINVSDARSANIRSRLPLVADVPTEQGTAFNQEIRRLNETWTSWTYSAERRMGVGSDVVIEAGVPIQIAGSFEHVITNGPITGKLVKETTVRYGGGHPQKPATPREMTDALFTVTVELPDSGEPESWLNPSTIDVHVPNDRLKKVEPPTEVSQE